LALGVIFQRRECRVRSHCGVSGGGISRLFFAKSGRSVVLNQSDPGALEERFLGLKPALEAAVRNHDAL